MFQYRQVLVRLRQGDSDRDIARARLMGRPKVAALRALAAQRGWLAADATLPDAAISAAVGQARRARSTISTVEPYRAQVERWLAEGVGGIAIHAALCREHGYRGSYSAVRRMLAGIRASLPPDVTVPLLFAPAEAAQVDFGAGPLLIDPARGELRRTWCFVMMLCRSGVQSSGKACRASQAQSPQACSVHRESAAMPDRHGSLPRLAASGSRDSEKWP